MHFYEASIITTKDGLHCQVYSNEHPSEGILVKPKYIPTEKLESSSLQYRFISGKKMNRLNLWINEEELKSYVENFKKQYPKYIYNSPLHKGNRLFFVVPFDEIERVYFPRKGLQELMRMPSKALDSHLTNVYEFVTFLLSSGVRLKDIGITYSTLMGHYSSKSDINVVIYGKNNYWRIINYLKSVKHSKLRWKTEQEWLDFHKKRNRFNISEKEVFLKSMMNKRSEGFFDETLFVIFGVEKVEDSWFRWGSEWYTDKGVVTVEGIVTDNHSSVVRPGCYEIANSKIIDGFEDVPVKKIVFYSRDYCDLVSPGGKLKACGILEKVDPRDGRESFYRVVVGYFDCYTNGRRDKEYIKVVEGDE
jgi:predicted nucleotidyltransferase